jgi:hypothetical protein
MSLPTLPRNEGLEKALGCSVVHYHEAIAYGQACRETALLDAMNATLPFGKTGAVIAAAIGVLK